MTDKAKVHNMDNLGKKNMFINMLRTPSRVCDCNYEEQPHHLLNGETQATAPSPMILNMLTTISRAVKWQNGRETQALHFNFETKPEEPEQKCAYMGQGQGQGQVSSGVLTHPPIPVGPYTIRTVTTNSRAKTMVSLKSGVIKQMATLGVK